MQARLVASTAELAMERSAREFAETALREALSGEQRYERPIRLKRIAAEIPPAPLKRKRLETDEKPLAAIKRAKAEPKPVKWWVRSAKG